MVDFVYMNDENSCEVSCFDTLRSDFTECFFKYCATVELSCRWDCHCCMSCMAVY